MYHVLCREDERTVFDWIKGGSVSFSLNNYSIIFPILKYVFFCGKLILGPEGHKVNPGLFGMLGQVGQLLKTELDVLGQIRDAGN